MISEGDNTPESPHRLLSRSLYPGFTDEETETQRLGRASPEVTGAVGMSPKALPLLGDSEAGPPGKAGWGAGGGAEPAPPLTLLLAPPPAPLQAFPRAAATDGVDPGGRGARRPPAQLLHGQRRRPPSGPAAAARRGLRAAPAQVGPPGGRREGAPFPDTGSPCPRVPGRGDRRQRVGLRAHSVRASNPSPAGRCQASRLSR